jgi:hypothetical protein
MRFICISLLISWPTIAPLAQANQTGTQPKSPHVAPPPSGTHVGHIVIVVGENTNGSDADRRELPDAHDIGDRVY